MNNVNAIEVKHIYKSFESFRLEDITFDLPKGCIMGLIGENGAGKSTTIGLITDSLKKESGEILVLGCDNEDPKFEQMKEDIGVVLDESYFPVNMTATAVNQMMKYTYKNWNEKVFNDYMHQFNLPLKVQFKKFSRGMKMKLAIATALSHDPKLLILDEATSGLDPIVRDEILDIFNDFTRDPEHSILISSHILSDLEKLCDYITFIHEGRMLFCEEKDALQEKYGIIRCSNREQDDIPSEAILGKKASSYGVECLVNRNLVSPTFTVERAGIEDIILHMVKGGRG